MRLRIFDADDWVLAFDEDGCVVLDEHPPRYGDVLDALGVMYTRTDVDADTINAMDRQITLAPGAGLMIFDADDWVLIFDETGNAIVDGHPPRYGDVLDALGVMYTRTEVDADTINAMDR